MDSTVGHCGSLLSSRLTKCIAVVSSLQPDCNSSITINCFRPTKVVIKPSKSLKLDA